MPTVSKNNDSAITKLAAVVRDAYCGCMRMMPHAENYGSDHMPQWDGGTTPGGRRCKPVWPKIAAKLLEINAEPLSYILAQFQGTGGVEPPRPNQLFNDAAIARWRNYELLVGTMVRQKVQSDFNQVGLHTQPLVGKLGWPYEKALNYVLRDAKIQISPLIRYCQAIAHNLDVANWFRDAALMQYLFQATYYDECVPGGVPADLRADAEAIRRQLIERQ